jgi:histidinol phosphatase-like PHP family hydrolase
MKYLSEYQDITKHNIPMVDFHIHTAWTDGVNSVKEMYDYAMSFGLEKVLFSEHVRKTSIDWFYEFVKEVRSLPKNGCQALVGIETKIIDFDGNLDCTPEMISECDLVVGSVHSFPEIQHNKEGVRNLSKRKIIDLEFELACKILENDNVDIIGHPFGMCYKHFNIQPDDKLILSLIEKAAKANIAFEINGYYHENPWNLIKLCKTIGTNFSLGSDAHKTVDVGKIVRLLKEKEG